jgi:hypothetical protein
MTIEASLSFASAGKAGDMERPEAAQSVPAAAAEARMKVRRDSGSSWFIAGDAAAILMALAGQPPEQADSGGEHEWHSCSLD